jgi:hypothetical protein
VSKKRQKGLGVVAIAVFEAAHELSRLAAAYEALVARNMESLEIQRRNLTINEARFDRQKSIADLERRVRAIEQREPA